jgi:hypothetical protein
MMFSDEARSGKDSTPLVGSWPQTSERHLLELSNLSHEDKDPLRGLVRCDTSRGHFAPRNVASLLRDLPRVLGNRSEPNQSG